jgi:DNA primase
MNAKEAKLTAQKMAEELKNEREAAEQKSANEHAKKWRKERADWYTNHISWIEESIKEAIDKGKDKTNVWLSSSDEPEKAKEEVFWKRFAFEPELKKVIAHFEDLGYQIKFRVKTEEHVDLSDLSPRNNWFTYETLLDINW